MALGGHVRICRHHTGLKTLIMKNSQGRQVSSRCKPTRKCHKHTKLYKSINWDSNLRPSIERQMTQSLGYRWLVFIPRCIIDIFLLRFPTSHKIKSFVSAVTIFLQRSKPPIRSNKRIGNTFETLSFLYAIFLSFLKI